MASPTRDNASLMAPPISKPGFSTPMSPRTHRTLRRLNSAHTLGASNKPSLIAQQRLQQIVAASPAGLRNDNTGVSTATQNHNRVRSSSDASATKEQAMSLRKQNSGLMRKAGEHVSLDRIVRDGPAVDMAHALDTIRLKILDQGIKSDSDGMVRSASATTQGNC